MYEKSSNQFLAEAVAAFFVAVGNVSLPPSLTSCGLFSVVLVRYSQLLAAMSAARSQYAATILCSHSLAEAMLVHATTIVRLKCSFHCLILICLLLFTLLGCKITHYFLKHKVLRRF